MQNLELGLSVKNKVALVTSSVSNLSGGGGGGSGSRRKNYLIKIKVNNQPEGPRFNPKVKAIPISEGDSSVNINQIIARYPAMDGDTGELATNVRSVPTRTNTHT